MSELKKNREIQIQLQKNRYQSYSIEKEYKLNYDITDDLNYPNSNRILMLCDMDPNSENSIILVYDNEKNNIFIINSDQFLLYLMYNENLTKLTYISIIDYEQYGKFIDDNLKYHLLYEFNNVLKTIYKDTKYVGDITNNVDIYLSDKNMRPTSLNDFKIEFVKYKEKIDRSGGNQYTKNKFFIHCY
jgi:hypothetical protein